MPVGSNLPFPKKELQWFACKPAGRKRGATVASVLASMTQAALGCYGHDHNRAMQGWTCAVRSSQRRCVSQCGWSAGEGWGGRGGRGTGVADSQKGGPSLARGVSQQPSGLGRPVTCGRWAKGCGRLSRALPARIRTHRRRGLRSPQLWPVSAVWRGAQAGAVPQRGQSWPSWGDVQCGQQLSAPSIWAGKLSPHATLIFTRSEWAAGEQQRVVPRVGRPDWGRGASGQAGKRASGQAGKRASGQAGRRERAHALPRTAWSAVGCGSGWPFARSSPASAAAHSKAHSPWLQPWLLLRRRWSVSAAANGCWPRRGRLSSP